MNKRNNSMLIAFLITILSLIVIIAIFFLIKNKTNSQNSPLEVTEQKIEEIDFDVTLIKPKEVFEAIRKEEFAIIDTRINQEFFENHIESSINIPLDKILKNENLLNKNKTIIFIEKQETLDGKKIANQLYEKGFKLNYLSGGLYNYIGNGYNLISFGDINSAQDRAKVDLIDLSMLGDKLQSGERFIYLDVRTKNDFEKDHFENSINIPLENLEKNKKNIPIGKILIIDENPNRSFQAAVRLADMNFLTTHYLTNKYSEFKEKIKNKKLFE